jgi:hypothetical protein
MRNFLSWVHLRCFGGPVLLILFGSPPVTWWGLCCSSYSVHLRCLGGSCVANLVRFTSAVLVGPVLLILFGSPPVFWWGLCCSSYSVHLRCFGGARVAHLIRFLCCAFFLRSVLCETNVASVSGK